MQKNEDKKIGFFEQSLRWLEDLEKREFKRRLLRKKWYWQK